MSGHSKWANIKRTKEREDSKRSKEFSKIAKDIAVVVRLSQNPDISSNPSLKTIVDKAKSLNMPKEKIEKAIKTGQGIKDADENLILENTYEFYGPYGTTFLVDCETDNPNRTISEIKIIAAKNSLKMASEGSISWDYKNLGVIRLKIDVAKLEETELELIEIDYVTDIIRIEGGLEIHMNREYFQQVYNLLDRWEISEAKLVKIANSKVELGEISMQEIDNIIGALEEFGEVVNIWFNFDYDE